MGGFSSAQATANCPWPMQCLSSRHSKGLAEGEGEREIRDLCLLNETKVRPRAKVNLIEAAQSST